MANKIDLSTQLMFDGEEYNINAVNATRADEADKVTHVLTLKKYNFSDKAFNNASTFNSFDGHANTDVTIVPAEGGRFKGRITVPSFPSTWATDKETILNYKDIVDTVLPTFADKLYAGLKSYTVLSEWTGEALVKYDQDDDTKNVGIIVGNNTDVNSFAKANHSDKYYTAFIYIADDTGNIYFGTIDSEDVNGVSINAENANTADTLTTAQTFRVNLDSGDSEVSFNGSEGVNLNVNGVLPPEKGGTGAADLATVTVGAANTLIDTKSGAAVTAENFIETRTKALSMQLVLDGIRTGTVNVENANKVSGHKVYVSVDEPTDATIGDIWIKTEV